MTKRIEITKCIVTLDAEFDIDEEAFVKEMLTQYDENTVLYDGGVMGWGEFVHGPFDKWGNPLIDASTLFVLLDACNNPRSNPPRIQKNVRWRRLGNGTYCGKKCVWYVTGNDNVPYATYTI